MEVKDIKTWVEIIPHTYGWEVKKVTKTFTSLYFKSIVTIRKRDYDTQWN